MIWKNGLTWKAKKELKENWHRWFAWYPITIATSDDRRMMKCWLETTYRRGTYHGDCEDDWWEWEYKTARRK